MSFERDAELYRLISRLPAKFDHPMKRIVFDMTPEEFRAIIARFFGPYPEVEVKPKPSPHEGLYRAIRAHR